MAAPRFSLILGPALVAAALFSAGPATADQAPAGRVTVSRACYVNTARALAQITVSGTGWEAGAIIELTDKLGRVSATATADAGGSFRALVPAPVVDPYRSPQIADAISAAYENDPGLPGNTGATASSAPFLTTNYEVLQTHNRTDPELRSTFELSGFVPNRTVYAHYLSASGKPLTTVSFGRPAGACGLRRVVAYEYPGGHPSRGTYTVQFDNAPTYRKLTQPAYRLTFQVRRS
jgi:hypothetical protein